MGPGGIKSTSNSLTRRTMPLVNGTSQTQLTFIDIPTCLSLNSNSAQIWATPLKTVNFHLNKMMRFTADRKIVVIIDALSECS